MDGSPVKAEESADHRKSGYKSWKKKYRKMRIVFDQKMQEGEDLHKQEDKASATVKRLAVENEYECLPHSVLFFLPVSSTSFPCIQHRMMDYANSPCVQPPARSPPRCQ